MFDIPCVIFAGGKSSRMGEDKALLPFDNSPTLTQFQLQKLQSIFKKVYISCKDSNKFSFDANFLEDINSKDIFAPTSGFFTAFEKLNCEKFFVISVDTPFITKDIIEKIISVDKEDVDATIAKTAFGIHPMCGIYHKSLKQIFLEMLKNDNHKLGLLLKKSKTLYVEFYDESKFLNINNPHEYKEALKRLHN
jgi:molybdopterin-guanine dinucleotide biosynthesis protein A